MGIDFVAELEIKNSKPLELGLELDKMRETGNFAATLKQIDVPEYEFWIENKD